MDANKPHVEMLPGHSTQWTVVLTSLFWAIHLSALALKSLVGQHHVRGLQIKQGGGHYIPRILLRTGEVSVLEKY